MGAVETNIDDQEQVFAGEDRSFEYVIKDSVGAALNMFGYSLTFELKTLLSDASPLFSKTVGSGITIGDELGTNDKATVAIEDTDTESLDGDYFHVLRRTDAGSESVLSFGKVTITSLGLTA